MTLEKISRAYPNGTKVAYFTFSGVVRHGIVHSYQHYKNGHYLLRVYREPEYQGGSCFYDTVSPNKVADKTKPHH